MYRRGTHAADGLKTWRCDTWREVMPGDAWLEKRGADVLAAARLRHDSFDYVDLDGSLFDVERVFLFVPGQMFLVIDRLTAAADAEATVGQAWHSASTVQVRDNVATFTRGEQRFTARFAQSRAMTWELSLHTGSEQDAFYFPVPVQDLLCHGAFRLKCE